MKLLLSVIFDRRQNNIDKGISYFNNLKISHWCPNFQRELTYSVLRLFYWKATGALSLIPYFTLSYLYKTPVFVPILSVNWVYQLTGYTFSPIKYRKRRGKWCSHVPKRTTPIGGARHSEHVLTTPIVGASIEWIKTAMTKYAIEKMDFLGIQ